MVVKMVVELVSESVHKLAVLTEFVMVGQMEHERVLKMAVKMAYWTIVKMVAKTVVKKAD